VSLPVCQRFFLTVTERTGVSYFHGFTGWVWLFAALQVGCGLLMLAVIKYADYVLYGMASCVLFSILFFGTPAVISLAYRVRFLQSRSNSNEQQVQQRKDAELIDRLPSPV
jgi:hypothetical protein